METTIKSYTNRGDRPPKNPEAIEVLKEILDRLERLDDRFDEFAGTFLNAKFPHGKATDRWARR